MSDMRIYRQQLPMTLRFYPVFMVPETRMAILRVSLEVAASVSELGHWSELHCLLGLGFGVVP